MLDPRLIRENPEAVKAKIATLFTDAPIDEIVELDTARRALLTEVESLKAQRNEGSKAVKNAKETEERQRLITQMREVGDRIATMDEEIKAIEAWLHDLMLRVPNLPDA